MVRRVVSLGLRGTVELAVLAALGVVVELGVRFQPLPRLSRWLGVPLSGTTTAGGPPVTTTERRRWRIVDMLIRHWPLVDREGLCLRRSFLLGMVLRYRDPILRIGVARVDGQVTAHAWLEVEGATIGADGIHAPMSFDASSKDR